MLTGLDVVLKQGLPELAGKRVGLITNHTGTDRGFRLAADLLHAAEGFELVALFGPEHGLLGEAQAGAKVEGAVDQRTGVPVYSLYGETEAPTPAMLAGIDVLVFDMLDIGARFTTYISTMANSQEAAAAAGLGFVVLDRPNPANGRDVAGNMLDPAFTSFVGIHPMPIRHGLTVGELAALIAAERGWPAPTVVPMRGWRREWWYDETGLPWVQPSPNLPTLDSLIVYLGTCLIEGTNLSEGRGTTRPFEYVGAPWLDPFALAEALDARDLPGVAYRPAYFTPTFSKHAGIACGGIQVHILDRNAMRPVELGIHLIDVARGRDPASFAWRQYADDGYPIDRLLGSDRPRRAFDDGATAAEVMATWAEESRQFEERRRPYLLY
ncbi:MAG: exo-beta-N-acetylmuramidase NamZ family protein [Thermomicrobiales bacterium]